MSKLSKKIAAALEGEGNEYVRLTGAELVSLTKMRKVVHFNLSPSVDRYLDEENDGTRYFPGMPCGIKVPRRQATQVAEEFARWDTRDDKQLYAQVYISSWRGDKLYVSF